MIKTLKMFHKYWKNRIISKICGSRHIKISDYNIKESKLSEDKYYLEYKNSLRSYRYKYTCNFSIHSFCLFNNLYKRITDVKEPNRGMNEYLDQKKKSKK